MNKGMVSIIIPVYNSKDRLAQCLESVAEQDYENKEVLIVDDCSTDGSLQICRKYEKKYPCVHVYTKKNEGVSAARNFGISKAEGEYIQFADSDDMLYPGMCRSMVERIESDNSDMVICGYFNEKENKEIVYDERKFQKKTEFMREFPALFSGFFIHVPWNKLYRREALAAGFPEDLDKGEDLIFNLRVLEGAEKVSVIRGAFYFYHNVSDDSLSFRFRENAMDIEERLYDEVSAFYDKNGGEGEPEFLYSYYLNAVKSKFYALLGRSGFSGRECRKYIREWCGKKSIKELYLKRRYFGVKDRILLLLMHFKFVFLLCSYYKKR